MGRVLTQSVRFILTLFMAVMTGVQLQDEQWNSGFLIPDSKIVFSPPLLFPHYRIPQRDYNHFIKPTTPHHAMVNFDHKETSMRRDPDKMDVWIKHSETEVKNHNGSIYGDSRVLLNEQGGYAENEYDMRKDRFNNITWHNELSKGEVGNYDSDIGLHISSYQLNGTNGVANLSDTDSGIVGNNRSDSNLDMSGHHVNDPNVDMGHNTHNSRDKYHPERIRNITWSNEFGTVRAGHKLSDSGPGMMEQDGTSRAGHRQLGHEKTDPTVNKLSKEYNDHNAVTLGQQLNEDKWDDSLQRIHGFERFSELGTNRFSDVTWQRGYGTERKQDNRVQNKSDSERRLYNITAWYSDSDRSRDKKDGSQDRHDLGGKLSDSDKRHSLEDISNYYKGFGNRFTEDTRYSDTDTGRDRLRISGENKGDTQHSYNVVRNQFDDVVWSSDTETSAEGKQNSDNTQSTFDSEELHFDEVNWQDNYHTTAGKNDPGEEEFNFQRNRFGDTTWHSGYSSISDYRVPQFNQEHEFNLDGNHFSGASWETDYSSSGERQHQQVSTYEETEFKSVSNQYSDIGLHRGGVQLHHGGHPLTRVAISPPRDVTIYRLPNGTRIVKLRRIVLLRKSQTTQPQEGSPRTFADIVKRIVQKKVAKLLSLFSIVQFPNEPCQTGEGVSGTCYHHLECKSLGGVASGTCAEGYGVCCYLFTDEKSCGEVTQQNCSYFVNPGFPSPASNMLACILTVQKTHPDVSQIRLDFFTFELLGPTNGTCIDDQFIVTGQNTNSIAPIICGINTGQHIYMDVDRTTGPFQLNMLTTGSHLPRSFRIKVTQIKKGSTLEAPRNCFQYHTGVRGSIESFNYQTLEGSNLPVRTGYMNNLNYAICIRKEPGYCSVTYTNTAPDGTAYPFQLTNVDQDGQQLIPPEQAGAEIFNCPDDYIVINGIRLCGERLNDASVQLNYMENYPVTDTSNGPFLIPVRTNANTNGRGFRINYQQNSCAG